MKKIFLSLSMLVSVAAFAAPNFPSQPDRGGPGMSRPGDDRGRGDDRDRGNGRDDHGGVNRPSPFPPSGGNNGRYQCRAFDNGWEEHFGGHQDCRSCIASHGTCTERCTGQQYRCTVEGRRRGRVENYTGRADNRRNAEEQALRDCRQDRSERCTVKRCETNNQTTTRACR